MNEIEVLLGQARELENGGKGEEALVLVSRAFDMLIEEAGKYAQAQVGTTDVAVLQEQKEIVLAHSNDFLQKDLTAAMLLNNLGLLFMSLGHYDEAKQKFQESAAMVPANEEYNDPVDNIQILHAKIAEIVAAQTDEELPR